MNGTESEPVVEEMSAAGRVINVFVSPRKTFESIDARPAWLLPFFLILLVNVVFILSSQDIIVEQTISTQETEMLARGAEPDEIEQTTGITRKMMQFTVFFGLGFTTVLLFLVPAVFLFVGNVVLGGSSTYKKVLCVTIHAWLIMSLAALVMLPLVLAKESMLVTFSLAAFLPESSASSFLYQLLSKVEVFTIWFLIVESIGLAVIYKMETKRVATAVFVTYLVYALGASGLSAFTSSIGR
jgi:hypothetical protein